MKLLLYSDVHVAPYSEFSKPTVIGSTVRTKDLIHSSEWLHDQILEHNPDVVIDGGDFYNSAIDISPLTLRCGYEFVSNVVSACSELNIQLIMNIGNHDILSEGIHALDHYKWVSLVADVMTGYDYKDITVIPYHKNIQAVYDIMGDSDRSVSIVHQDILGGLMNTEVRSDVGVDVKHMRGVVFCFTGDTEISLLNGTEVAIKDLVGEEEFWVYSYDIKTNKIVPGRGHSARLTKKNAKLVKVTLDNDEEIRCTLDHRFLMRDGTYKEARYLNPQDSLMPLYRRKSRTSQGELDGYDMCHAGTGDWEYTHRITAALSENNVCEVCNDDDKPTYVHGFRHHKDFNKLNNDPDNFAWLTWREHFELHSAINQEHNRSNSMRECSRDTMHRNWSDPEFRRKVTERRSKSAKKMWTDPEYLAKMKIANSKHMNKLHVQLWNDPNYVAKMLSVSKMAMYKTRFNKFNMILDIVRKSGLPLSELSYNNARESLKGATNSGLLITYSKAVDYGFIGTNHKVSSVEFLDIHEDVYDFTVDNYHNFALSTGVFVHNSGHYHKSQYIEGGNSSLYVIGSLMSNHFGDSNLDDHGIIIYDTKSQTLDRFHNPASPIYITKTLNTMDDISGLKDIPDRSRTYLRLLCHNSLIDEVDSIDTSEFRGCRSSVIPCDITVVDSKFNHTSSPIDVFSSYVHDDNTSLDKDSILEIGASIVNEVSK